MFFRHYSGSLGEKGRLHSRAGAPYSPVIEVDEDSHSKYIPPGASGIGAEEEMRGGSGRKRGGGDDDDLGRDLNLDYFTSDLRNLKFGIHRRSGSLKTIVGRAIASSR